MRRSLLIYNAKAGRQVAGKPLDPVVAALRKSGYEVEAVPTSGPGDATSIVREAVQGQRVEVVFALGGDGTLREAAAGMLGSEVALAPLPAGTVNVVSLALGLPNDPLGAAAKLGDATVLEVDVGRCGREPFLMVASAGLDAHVLARVDLRLKRWLGKAAVTLEGVRDWWSYAYPELELVADGRTRRASLAAVANLPFYGGRHRLVPWANWQDRRLDLLLFHGRGRAATLAFARDLLLGRHHQRHDVEIFAVDTVELTAPQNIEVELDGDVLRQPLPLTIELAPERLRILAPRNQESARQSEW